jgi:hypothetical protein
VDSILGYVDFALIEYTSLSSRGILYLVEVANNATKHIRKDFIAACGGAHWRFPCSILGTYHGGHQILPSCRSYCAKLDSSIMRRADMKLRKEIVVMIASKFARLTAAIAIIAAVTCLGAASGRDWW